MNLARLIRRTGKPVLPVPEEAKERSLRTALPWLLGSLVLAALPLYSQLPLWILVVFGACLLWRYLLDVTRRPLPSLPVRLLLFLPCAFLILRTYGAQPNSTGLLAILVALLSLKVLELHTPRDFTIASLLGYFMALSVLFYDQSFVLFLYLSVSILMNSMALIQSHGGLRRAWPAARLALGMTLQAAPLVLLLFVVFPRVQASFLRRFNAGQKGQTGMSEILQPGSFSSLVQSNELALRAKIDTQTPLRQGQLYWRGLVLEKCDHPLAWRHLPPMPSASKLPSQPGDTTQEIIVISKGNRWLYALDRPAGMVRVSSGLKAEYSKSQQTFQSIEPLYNNVVYTVTSTLDSSASREFPDERRKLYTQLPPDMTPRGLELARSWRAKAQNDEQVLTLAQQFFQNGGFTYTLNPGLLPRNGALDYFLFTSHKGFCEHYAAAYCVLMRAAGIPARVVIGYQGGEYNRWGGHWTIRQSDAHAWAEVWLPNRGWVRQDPTALVAPERVSYGAENFAALSGSMTDEMRLNRLNDLNAPGSLRWLLRNGSQLWDSLDQQWNLLVLGFDEDTRLTLLEKFHLDKLDLLGGVTLTLAVAFSILAMGAGFVYLLNRRSSRTKDRVKRLYERFCHKLARGAGLQRGSAEGPLDFARRAEAVLPSQKEGIQRITDLYVASRYAKDGGESTFNALRSAVGGFRVERNRSAPST